MDAPRPAPPVLPGRATGSSSKGHGFGPRCHLAARSPASPAWLLPVPSVGSSGGAGRPSRPRHTAARPGSRTSLVRPRDVQCSQRQDARGSAGSRGPVGLSPAQCHLQSSARSPGHFAKCSPDARCCVPTRATERERRGAGSTRPDCGDPGRRVGDSGGVRGRGLTHSLRSRAVGLSSRAAASSGPPPSERAGWPAALGQWQWQWQWRRQRTGQGGVFLAGRETPSC